VHCGIIWFVGLAQTSMLSRRSARQSAGGYLAPGSRVDAVYVAQIRPDTVVLADSGSAAAAAGGEKSRP